MRSSGIQVGAPPGTAQLIEVDARCLGLATTPERYQALGVPFVFLEPGWYAPIGRPQSTD